MSNDESLARTYTTRRSDRFEAIEKEREMRTAEVIHNEVGLPLTAQHAAKMYADGFRAYTKADIQQIQVNAMKEGMRRAAKIVVLHGWRNEPQMKHILTTAEQLTEKDL